MKKIFANPEIEIRGFELENIVTTSGPIAGGSDTEVTAETAAIGVNVGEINNWVDNTLF
jgi:hypothetical protein